MSTSRFFGRSTDSSSPVSEGQSESNPSLPAEDPEIWTDFKVEELCNKGGGASSSFWQGESSLDRRSSDGAPKFWRNFKWEEFKASLKGYDDLLRESDHKTSKQMATIQTKQQSSEDKLSLVQDYQQLTNNLLERGRLAEEAFYSLYKKLQNAPNPWLLSSDAKSSTTAEKLGTCSNVDSSGSDKKYFPLFHNQFEHREKLGEGGFGKVFYAVKIIPFNDSTEDKTLREVDVLSDLEHTSIIRYYHAWIEERHSEESEEEEGDDVSEENPYVLYIQMELCNSTLRKVIGQGLDNKKAWDYFNQIVEGVCYMHSKGVIHRDLSTINIMIDSRMNIKIADFGLAKTQGALPLLLSRDGIGNLMYRAPEFESVGAEITDKVDIYSLGLILCEMLYKMNTDTGRLHAFNDLKTNSILPRGHLKLKYRELILSMISSVAADRPSAAEVLVEASSLEDEMAFEDTEVPEGEITI